MKLKFVLFSMIIMSSFLMLNACNDSTTIKPKDNSSDNGSNAGADAFMLFDFGDVKTGMIKVAKVKYTGSNTTMTINAGYSDKTMLDNGTAPNIMTTCGGDTGTTTSTTLQTNCEMAFAFSPSQVKRYGFTMPTNLGKIVFSGSGVTTNPTTAPKITLDKTAYNAKSFTVPMFGTIYYDNITITQSTGTIDTQFVFADTNMDPAVATFTPAEKGTGDNFSYFDVLNFNDADYCTFDPDTFRVTGTGSSCKVLMVLNDPALANLGPGTPLLTTGRYSTAVGFISGNETLVNGAKITVDYTARTP